MQRRRDHGPDRQAITAWVQSLRASSARPGAKDWLTCNFPRLKQSASDWTSPSKPHVSPSPKDNISVRRVLGASYNLHIFYLPSATYNRTTLPKHHHLGLPSNNKLKHTRSASVVNPPKFRLEEKPKVSQDCWAHPLSCRVYQLPENTWPEGRISRWTCTSSNPKRLKIAAERTLVASQPWTMDQHRSAPPQFRQGQQWEGS